jgi:hypothetical protein
MAPAKYGLTEPFYHNTYLDGYLAYLPALVDCNTSLKQLRADSD